MKICKNCGAVNYKPKKKCPECKKGYGETYDCDPLSSSTVIRDDDNSDGFYTTGDPNAKQNKD